MSLDTYPAQLAVITQLPAAVSAAVPVERRVAAQQNIHNDAQGPEIAPLVVGSIVPDERLNHLRSHKLGTANLK